MANEIQTTTAIQVTNGSLTHVMSATVQNVDQTTAKRVSNTQNIGTSAENIDVGDLTTPRWAVFTNLDSTNYVEIGVDNTGFVAFLRLEAGKTCGPLPIGVAAPQAKADTAAIELDYTIYDA